VRELSLHVLDLLENSLEAGATRICVEIDEQPCQNLLKITVADNGRGMDAETQTCALDPFFTTRSTRHVGLGLPLLRAAAERCGGGLELQSQPGVGTTVVATFERDHIDRAPLGDMVSTLMGALLSRREGWDLRYTHRVGDRVLGEVPLWHPAVRDWLQAYLRQGYDELYGEPSARILAHA